MYNGFKIIVIEGMDCSGKETVSKILARQLKKENNIVLRMSIPDYMVNDYLTNFITHKINNEKLNKLNKESIYEVTRLFIHNMATGFHNRFNKKLRSLNNITKDKYIILDRYYHSGMIYQAKRLFDMVNNSKVRIDNRKEAISILINEYKRFLLKEKELFNLPKPDYVFFLRSTPEIINKLLQNRPIKGSNNNEDPKSVEDLYDFLFNQFTGEKDNIEYRYGYYEEFKDLCDLEKSIVYTIDNHTYFDYDRIDQLDKLIRVEYDEHNLIDYRLSDPREIVNYIKLILDGKTSEEDIQTLFLHDLQYIDAVVEEFKGLNLFNWSVLNKQREIQTGNYKVFLNYETEPIEFKKNLINKYLRENYNTGID